MAPVGDLARPYFGRSVQMPIVEILPIPRGGRRDAGTAPWKCNAAAAPLRGPMAPAHWTASPRSTNILIMDRFSWYRHPFSVWGYLMKGQGVRLRGRRRSLGQRPVVRPPPLWHRWRRLGEPKCSHTATGFSVILCRPPDGPRAHSATRPADPSGRWPTRSAVGPPPSVADCWPRRRCGRVQGSCTERSMH